MKVEFNACVNYSSCYTAIMLCKQGKKDVSDLAAWYWNLWTGCAFITEVLLSDQAKGILDCLLSAFWYDKGAYK